MDRDRIDYDLIGEVGAPRGEFPVQSAAFAEEVNALDQAKLQYDQQRVLIELDRLKTEVDNERQDIELRKTFSKSIFNYLWKFSIFCGAIIVLQGFDVFGFRLATPVLVTLVGGTAASAFGLVSVVLGGLFRGFPTRTRSDRPQSDRR